MFPISPWFPGSWRASLNPSPIFGSRQEFPPCLVLSAAGKLRHSSVLEWVLARIPLHGSLGTTRAMVSSLHGEDGQTSSCGCRAASQLIVSPLGEPTCPGTHPTRLRTFRVSHIQDLWRFCTCKTLGYLCTQGISAPKAFVISLHLESLLPMQNLRGVSAPRISGVYPNTKLLGCHCTSGAFLHPRALGASATEISWGVSHPAALKHFTPRTSGVSLLPEPLEHPAPKTFGVSHALGSGALCPPGSAHRRGP